MEDPWQKQEREEMSINCATGRLLQERKAWRKNHPPGFTAKPEKSGDGLVNLMVWRCTIPGLPNTDWEGGSYPITIFFSEDYPVVPPNCWFPSGFFHPNVYPSGRVCLSILDATSAWQASVSVEDILLGIQHLLNNPNAESTAQSESSQIWFKQPDEYRRRVKEQASRYPLQV